MIELGKLIILQGFKRRQDNFQNIVLIIGKILFNLGRLLIISLVLRRFKLKCVILIIEKILLVKKIKKK
jgi:predicted membrane protein